MLLSKAELTVLAAAVVFGARELFAYWRRRPRVVSLPRTENSQRATVRAIDPDVAAPADAETRPRTAATELLAAAPLWNLAAFSRAAIRDSRGDLWFLCACCQYPTLPNSLFPDYRTCPLCDFDDPSLEVGEYPITAAALRAAGEEARASFLTHGSVITPEERASYDGQLSPAELDLRVTLRRVLDYLLGGERPDGSERWAEVSELLRALRQAERQRQEGHQREF